jgi:trehalose-6-phosphate synthase
LHWLLRLVITLILVMGCVAFAFSFGQARHEEARLAADIERHAHLLAEDFSAEAKAPLEAGDLPRVQDQADRLLRRQKISGLSIHNSLGQRLVTTAGFGTEFDKNPSLIAEDVQRVESEGAPYDRFLKIGPEHFHVYSYPMIYGKSAPFVLSLFHDADYVTDRVRRIWINGFLRVIAQIFVICLATLGVVYISVMRPMKKAAEWIRRLRHGETAGALDPKQRQFLGALGKEISKMAKSLEMARISAEEEARLRLSSEAIWTAERLKEFVRARLQGRTLVAVSNREPYMHMKKGNQVEWIMPASGLVTAIEPVLKACGGLWVAQGSGDADRLTVDANDRLRVPPDEPQYVLRRVWVDGAQEKGFYNGFSNEGLWPLCHIAHTRPVFRSEDWEHYLAVNRKFADAVLEEIGNMAEPFVLIQDYHFALLPRMIKKERPDARVAIFWHIPWPNPESFGICPWQKELLEGMLGADLVGFHTQFHCNNFIETVDRFLESRIDYENFTVNREGQTTWIKPFPISIDAGDPNAAVPTLSAEDSDSQKAAFLKKQGIDAEFLGVGVDRLDYTKGILERFRSIERFLEKNPKYVGRFTFVELGAPSRVGIQQYADFIAEVEREVERINARFKKGNWKAIVMLKKHHTHAEIRPFYRFADLCMVTSLHDGMNLVAKEFIASRDDDKGVLILSQFTGAARELEDALIVNPYDLSGTADAIRQALEMTLPERNERMRDMRRIVRERNIYRWAADLVAELAHVRIGGPREAVALRMDNV